MKNLFPGVVAVTILIGSACANLAATARPNIVVILTDDQGYADISLNPGHPREVSTPHMDALAQDGVVFSQGYTSGHVCSPTRAGIMIGGYQQRVGVYSAGDGGRGFDPTKKIFPGFLPDEYVSTAIGKWHLGLDDDYPELKWHAMNRGFDECYKFMGRGGHSYFNLRSDTQGKFSGPIYRNRQRINDKGYLTNRLSEEAVAFIDRNKKNPFFLYLAYNAVHAPAEAPESDIRAYQQKFPGLSQERAILMAMLKHLDNGVGDVVARLKQEGLFDNTILLFLTDNGGSNAMRANNTPLRGFKGSLDEGGIRTPFIVSWPDRFQGGRTIDTPVISFDILPTVLDAVGNLRPHNDFDGRSLLPLLTGETTSHHDTLFWSRGPADDWAVRRGDWKLHAKNGELELVNLATDPSEKQNLAAGNADKVTELKTAFDNWIATMADPITGGKQTADSAKPIGPDTDRKVLTEREKKRVRIRAEKKKQRAAEKKSSTKKQTPTGPAAQVAISLDHWKLTLPTDSKGRYDGHATEISAEQLVKGFKDDHFQIDTDGSLVFWCPVNGAVTEGTEYPRSELREMLQPGNPSKNWTVKGTHVMKARCRVEQIPGESKVVIGQIHGYSGKSKPLLKLQYFKGRLEALVKLSPNKGEDRKLTFSDVELNSDISWQFKLHDGSLSITVNELTQTQDIIPNDKRWAKQTFYFKAGAYPQDNRGPSSKGARVRFSELRVSHTD